MSGPNPLAAYLGKRAISMGAFARALGVKSGVVSRWASGKRVPTLHFALRIARETKGEVPVSAWEDEPAQETQRQRKPAKARRAPARPAAKVVRHGESIPDRQS